MLKMKKSFTLAETLIMIAVIGIIAIITIFSLEHIKPDKDVIMLKKAYTDISNAVSTLINDRELYPPEVAINNYLYNLNYTKMIMGASESGEFNFSGLNEGDQNSIMQNLSNYSNEAKEPIELSESNIEDGEYDDADSEVEVGDAGYGNVFTNVTIPDGVTAYDANNKFAYNFANLFKTKNLQCNSNTCSFSTTDGMRWQIVDNFNNGNENALIGVVVNKLTPTKIGANPNQFTFEVNPSGHISVFGNDAASNKAKKALASRKY